MYKYEQKSKFKATRTTYAFSCSIHDSFNYVHKSLIMQIVLF